jgi:hypothetical protein
MLTREFVETFIDRVKMPCPGCNTAADKAFVDRSVMSGADAAIFRKS